MILNCGEGGNQRVGLRCRLIGRWVGVAASIREVLKGVVLLQSLLRRLFGPPVAEPLPFSSVSSEICCGCSVNLK
jgi:hypothetical protein